MRNLKGLVLGALLVVGAVANGETKTVYVDGKQTSFEHTVISEDFQYITLNNGSQVSWNGEYYTINHNNKNFTATVDNGQVLVFNDEGYLVGGHQVEQIEEYVREHVSLTPYNLEESPKLVKDDLEKAPNIGGAPIEKAPKIVNGKKLKAKAKLVKKALKDNKEVTNITNEVNNFYKHENEKIDKQGAVNMSAIQSLSAIHLREEGQNGVGVGIGTMNGEGAVSFSFASLLVDNDDYSLKTTATVSTDFSGDETSAGAGIGFSW